MSSAMMIMLKKLKHEWKAIIHLDEPVVIGNKEKWTFEAVDEDEEFALEEVIHVAKVRGVFVSPDVEVKRVEPEKRKTIKMW